MGTTDSGTAPASRTHPSPSAEQAAVTRTYDRQARWYDLFEAPMELLGTRRRRRRLLRRARGRVIEAGVGTGRNLEHYPVGGAQVTGVDVSHGMLARARRRAERRPGTVLVQADVQDLPFPDATFDTAVATCVFCSVADPVRGLRELGRVTRPEGRILLLEHVRPRSPLLGRIADLLTPLTRRLFGFRVNRRTEENVAAAGLEIVDVRRDGIWREIEARPRSTT